MELETWALIVLLRGADMTMEVVLEMIDDSEGRVLVKLDDDVLMIVALIRGKTVVCTAVLLALTAAGTRF